MQIIKIKNSPIKLEKIHLGNSHIYIPIATIKGKNPGKKIVITAGFDGDEYAGIQAAYQLIEYWSHHQPQHDTTIIPIFNVPGFEENVSYNPLDNKFPKHVFPGKKNGSPTEQLIHWFATTILEDTSIWIDLHSGSLTEELLPFIWTYKTNNSLVDTTVSSILSHISPEYSVFDQQKNAKTQHLAKHTTTYFLLESGERGESNNKAIQQHVSWVKKIVTYKNTQAINTIKPNSFHSINEYIAVNNGLFVPICKVGEWIKKGQLLGTIQSIDKKEVQKVTSGVNGIILWKKMPVFCKKGETVIGVAQK